MSREDSPSGDSLRTFRVVRVGEPRVQSIQAKDKEEALSKAGVPPEWEVHEVDGVITAFPKIEGGATNANPSTSPFLPQQTCDDVSRSIRTFLSDAVRELESETRNDKCTQRDLVLQLDTISTKIFATQLQLATLKKFLAGDNSLIDEKIGAEVKTLQSMINEGYIETLATENNILYAVTPVIYLEYEGCYYPIGKFRINLNDPTQRYFVNLDLAGKYCHIHPHILHYPDNHETDVCWGNLYGKIEPLITQLEFSAALQVLLSFVRSYNPNDAYTIPRRIFMENRNILGKYLPLTSPLLTERYDPDEEEERDEEENQEEGDESSDDNNDEQSDDDDDEQKEEEDSDR